jgi:hypothetical protein
LNASLGLGMVGRSANKFSPAPKFRNARYLANQ